MILLTALGSTGIIFIIAGWILSKYPPKEINPLYGYRTKKSMSNQQRWDFSQKYSGKIMIKTGILLAVLGGVGFFVAMDDSVSITITVLTLVGSCVFLFLKVEREIIKNDERGTI